MNLLDNTAMALAFESYYNDSIYVGLEGEDANLEYYLVGLAERKQKEDFVATALEHYDMHLTEDEQVWLEQQRGAIVEEDSGAGYVEVYFYDNEEELQAAWASTAKHAAELQKEIEEEAAVEERRERHKVKREIAAGRQAVLEV